MINKRFPATTLFCGFFLTVGMLAQNPRGDLQGSVQDIGGARVQSAKVVVQAAESSPRRETVTDARGSFRIKDLLPGNYEVTVTASGFAEARSQVKIVVTSVLEIAVVLKPASVQQSVKVEGEGSSITAQPIDPTTAVQQSVITLKDLEEIPLAHRSFANIAYLAPMTEPVEPSDPTKARITAVSFGGSSGLNVDLSVDGGDNNDDFIGGFLQNFSPDTMT